ncbi:hypothetical protein GALL_216630 [mine drainage metagenome]|uniref:Uncharacterized protein n=1 Tax=mine drainage metagenome TaxID=410659 RepID=A0A1J5RJP5_9ZZZZ
MNENRFNSIMDVVRNKMEMTIHIGKRIGDGVITAERKKLNMAVWFDSASVINSSGLVVGKGIAVDALSCGGFV